MKLLSVITPCYNEEDNVFQVYQRVKSVFEKLEDFDYEHIFLDNCSEDNTLQKLKEIAKTDKHVKIVVNSRNFGPTKSVFNGVLLASGDAAILLAADLQDPPELIPQFIRKWEKGYKAVFGIRKNREESLMVQLCRKLYYRVLSKISDDPLRNDVGDFVLIDRVILNELNQIKDIDPYIRGLIPKLGFPQTGIEYNMKARVAGKSSTSWPSLIWYALHGITSHSVLPLRVALVSGFILSFLSILVAIIQMISKLIFWDTAISGIATIIVALFFFSGVQLFLIGFLGEYIGKIYLQSKEEPRVVIKEKVNFD